MKYKEFRKWCNNRSADGCWSMHTAMFCINIMDHIDGFYFWRREKVWKEFENEVVENVIIPINNKMKEVYGQGDPLVKDNQN